MLFLWFTQSQKTLAVCWNRCEKGVMSSVNVRNCIRFYQTAEELNASTLMNYCGEIIASHWVSSFKFLWLSFEEMQLSFAAFCYISSFESPTNQKNNNNSQESSKVLQSVSGHILNSSNTLCFIFCSSKASLNGWIFKNSWLK